MLSNTRALRFQLNLKTKRKTFKVIFANNNLKNQLIISKANYVKSLNDLISAIFNKTFLTAFALDKYYCSSDNEV